MKSESVCACMHIIYVLTWPLEHNTYMIVSMFVDAVEGYCPEG